MGDDKSIGAASASLRNGIAEAARGLVDRASLVESVVLAGIAGEHLLVIGPPGTAKSEAVRRIAGAVGGGYFEYLLGRFTEPSELFGPIDLRKLRDGVVETETAGMLPEAEIAFLDEIFLGSTAILNTLLGILNERVFRRGHTRVACPLRLCVGASNALPDDESLAAFADRFLVRVFVDPIPDPRIEELLEGGWGLASSPGTDGRAPVATIEDLDRLASATRLVSMDNLRSRLAHAIRLLRGAGIFLTDRRAVKVQRLIAAAAVLAGRTTATQADLWPLILAIPTREEQTVARDLLRDLLAPTENGMLMAAAEDASAGPLARARRIAASGREILAIAPPADPDALRGWQLKLEGIVREMDAGFIAETLPEELADLRARIAGILRPEATRN